MWTASTTCVRISMLSLLHTIFWAGNFTRRATYVLGIANIMFFVGALIFWSVVCRPFTYYWAHRLGAQGQCGSVQKGLLAVSICNIILDFRNIATVACFVEAQDADKA